jgi:hypothetical protein
LPNFLSEHNTRVKSRTAITRDKLTEGMIIKCRYASQDLSTGEYIFLVLDTSYKGHLHALSMNEFNSRTFRELAATVGTTPVPGRLFEKNNILKLKLPGSPRTMYGGLLKSGMGSKYNTSYRTLDIKKMTGIMLLEYNLEN